MSNLTLRAPGPCAGVRAAADDIEASVVRHLEPVLGRDLSRAVLQQALERIAYESTTRRVTMIFRDRTQSQFLLRSRHAAEFGAAGLSRWRARPGSAG